MGTGSKSVCVDRLQWASAGRRGQASKREEGTGSKERRLGALAGGGLLFRRGVGPTYLHKRGHSRLFLVIRDRLQIGVYGHFVTGGGWVSWRVGWRGTRPARAGKLWRGESFRALREGWMDRFQCLLQPGPAAALVAGSVPPIYTKRDTAAYFIDGRRALKGSVFAAC